MIAVDTNILIRFLMQDDFLQSKRAEKILTENHILISTTVIMEMEWVLRATFKQTRPQILKTFHYLLSQNNISFVENEKILQAIYNFQQGFDFADALHLTQSQNASSLVTFDKDFIRLATQYGLKPIVQSP